METNYGFKKMTLNEFENEYIKNLKIARTVLTIQQHHTYSPSYEHFNGSNHFDRQKAMQNYHKGLGWLDIGQHYTIFPDGTILTGRNMEINPAGIAYRNSNAVCIENLGNFDEDGDKMNEAQKEAIIGVTAALCKKFGITPSSNSIVYHHWFRLSDGFRNNGSGGNKSCPGTNFFGGNKVEDFEKNFLPLVKSKMGEPKTPSTSEAKLLKYVVVTANSLNIRIGASSSSIKVTSRNSALFGAILRVYEVKNGWLKISSSTQCWVSGKYTKDVKRAIVNATVLNVRSGPGTNYSKVGSVNKDDEIFVFDTQNGWSQIGFDFKWVSNNYLDFQ